MAHTKAGGSTKNLRDSKPKYLGIKIADGARARAGAIIVRQRGTYYYPGRNVGIGKDHTLFSLRDGIVSFKDKRKTGFNGQTKKIKMVSIS